MEIVRFKQYGRAHHKELCIDVIEKTIEYARRLNCVDNVLLRHLPGTEFLHGMLEKGLIPNDLYEQLKRLAEDITLEYEIITQ